MFEIDTKAPGIVWILYYPEGVVKSRENDITGDDAGMVTQDMLNIFTATNCNGETISRFKTIEDAVNCCIEHHKMLFYLNVQVRYIKKWLIKS